MWINTWSDIFVVIPKLGICKLELKVGGSASYSFTSEVGLPNWFNFSFVNSDLIGPRNIEPFYNSAVTSLLTSFIVKRIGSWRIVCVSMSSAVYRAWLRSQRQVDHLFLRHISEIICRRFSVDNLFFGWISKISQGVFISIDDWTNATNRKKKAVKSCWFSFDDRLFGSTAITC